MRRALVIADDLTGAAEIAGIGMRFGLPTTLVLDRPEKFADGLTVIDSDSRSLSSTKAGEQVIRLIHGVDPSQFDLIYKKTDSAMRGQILVEIVAVMEEFQLSDALVVPQNPSRGRTIVNGEYRIDGVPLHQTSFADDPDHPAKTSDVRQLLGDSHLTSVCAPADGITPAGIAIGSAANPQDIRSWADRVTAHALPAGGADFFAAILEAKGLRSVETFLASLQSGRRLFVCGSASRYRDRLIARATASGFAVCLMPDNVFAGADASAWRRAVLHSVQTSPRTLVAIRQPPDRNRSVSLRLQSVLAELVAHIVHFVEVDHLFLDGGATASAVCGHMSWNQLQVIDELATGVVRMRSADSYGQEIVIKPGSYPWPDWVLAER